MIEHEGKRRFVCFSECLSDYAYVCFVVGAGYFYLFRIGFYAIREGRKGSWFIQALCEQLLATSHLDHLDTIMNKVTLIQTAENGNPAGDFLPR